jgi:hypothetical protein
MTTEGGDILYYQLYKADGTTLWGGGMKTVGSSINVTCTGNNQQISVIGKILRASCIPDPRESTCNSRYLACRRRNNACSELNPGAHNPQFSNYQIGCTNNPLGENACQSALGGEGKNACQAGAKILQSLGLCSGSKP